MLATFSHGSTFGLIFGYDVFTNIMMAALIALSVYSWAVIFFKRRMIRGALAANRVFYERFKARRTIEDAFAAAVPGSPVFQVLAEGMSEAKRLSGGGALDIPPDVLPNIQAAMEREIAEQSERLGSRLVSLATISTVSPLLGLLGTVWGIMIAFLDIKRFGSASIQVVAPGIAEALITTITGLVVAIPASMAYNAFTVRIRRIANQMENLSSEFLGDIRVHSVMGKRP
ncbi:MAG: MotA/TolQ/ExbB proton channel family protein [Candidatus Edwardsbacteria bacterium]|nr:MotA/TolQ/ExbB proton channel family protein [Candidatus Edwardsbacteria bacterium]